MASDKGNAFLHLDVPTGVEDRKSDPAMSELVLSFLAWAAKQEHVRISERTKAGLERTRANGTRLGRPKKHTFDLEEAKRLRGEGKSWNEIIKELGLPAEARGSVVRAVGGKADLH